MSDFLKDTAERAVKTGCQVAVTLIGTSVYVGDVNWLSIVSSSVLAMVVSVLTSFGSYNVGTTGTASMVD